MEKRRDPHLGVGLLLQGGRGVRKRRCLKEEEGMGGDRILQRVVAPRVVV